ncbi:uncharacterized protein PHACADRAFT_252270 [Phanerochaete carnosa HHB-10118-sp]|uniref:NADP-dependent oxidoreductase domain-containing protein n=1 Tax=Phanerochaete carnosa (strain HHB-10118-sp) TaxID=650164 RepID=K5X5N8_PHACS|nr:uncharacterized protein PHACADRAFT_252270 [Phanerochaete carnosa HHB-10118-sp]EKM58172.1 hypothetical protein PHACADRAFT_252270 [Phanerochaete carnosa HHB-10118-sp]
MPLPTRKIGDADVGCIGFGGMVFSANYGPTKPDEDRLKVGGLSHAAGSPAANVQRCLRFWMLPTSEAVHSGTRRTAMGTARTSLESDSSAPTSTMKISLPRNSLFVR